MTFTEKELEFLEKELGITPAQAAALSEDELLELGDQCFDIELEGDLQDGSKMPDRCAVAAGIMDKISQM
jgi:hypothetical protein